MNRYSANDFTPNAGQIARGMGHSIFAQVEIDHTVTNQEMADRVAARTGFKSYEAKAIIEALAEVATEELLEGNKVQLNYSDGKTWMHLRPKVDGRISDAEVLRKTTAAHAADPSVAIRKVATANDLVLTPKNWRVACSVGVRFSEIFRNKLQMSRVPAGWSGSQSNGSTDSGSEGGSTGGAEELP